MRHARLIRLAIGIMVSGLLLAWLLQPSAAWVEAAHVERGNVRASIEAEGRTHLRDRYLITAPMAANTRRVLLEPGDAVAAGDPLITLDPLTAPTLDARSRAEARAALAASQAQLSSAKEQLGAAQATAEQAAHELARLQSLRQKQLVSDDTLEHAQLQAQVAEREAKSARFMVATVSHEVQAAQARLNPSRADNTGDGITLRAPTAAVLLRRHVESAQPVNTGQALLEIGDPATLEVEVDVLSSDAVQLREGLTVELTQWGESTPLHGMIRRIEPSGFTKVSALGVEEQRVWVRISLTSPPAQWQRLGDAYRVQARFIMAHADDVTRIPSSALFRDDTGWQVFLIDNDRLRQHRVEPGVTGEGWSEIVSGLQPGQTVVRFPDRALQENLRVRIR